MFYVVGQGHFWKDEVRIYDTGQGPFGMMRLWFIIQVEVRVEG